MSSQTGSPGSGKGLTKFDLRARLRLSCLPPDVRELGSDCGLTALLAGILGGDAGAARCHGDRILLQLGDNAVVSFNYRCRETPGFNMKVRYHRILMSGKTSPLSERSTSSGHTGGG